MSCRTDLKAGDAFVLKGHPFMIGGDPLWKEISQRFLNSYRPGQLLKVLLEAFQCISGVKKLCFEQFFLIRLHAALSWTR